MDLDLIIASRPVNKAASIVTSQSGCDEEMSLDQKRECLALRINQINREIMGLPKGHKIRNELGQEKHQLQCQINAIHKKLKISRTDNIGLDNYIIKACKDRFTKLEWNSVIEEAKLDKSNSEQPVEDKKINDSQAIYDNELSVRGRANLLEGDLTPSKRDIELYKRLEQFYKNTPDSMSNACAIPRWVAFNHWCNERGYTQNEISQAKKAVHCDLTNKDK